MKNRIAVIIGLLAGISAFSQNTSGDSLKAKYFEWSIPVIAEWPGLEKTKIDQGIITYVVFFGQYKSVAICDFTDYWKCYSVPQLYEMKAGEFTAVSNQDFFNTKREELLRLINEQGRKYYDTLKLDSNVSDMLGEFEYYKNLNQSEVSFSVTGVSLGYSFDLPSFYDCCSSTSISFSWNEILPYLKNQNTQTPNYCTPSGPGVNVRSEESVKASVNFQLDKGEFFEILEVGKKDKVNGNDGSWYKIDYRGQTGYIFSFYTLCKDI